MIVKQLDELSSEDKFAKAGRAAEAQMAYYLRRAFGEDKNVFVFNNLRIEKEQDSAQIDHLILYQYGIFIVESKSVTTSIEINENGEWIRWFNGKPKGMPSPVLQAQRQGEFLRKYLNDRAEILLDKILGLRQATFRNMPLDILVAISDSGIIKRPNKVLLGEVCKADQVAERIRVKIEKSNKDNSWFNLDLTVSNYSFTQNELTRITKFLLTHHKPFTCKQPEQTNLNFQSRVDKPKPANTEVQPVGKIVCRHCQHDNLSIEYGKYGYYFKCMECNGNTSINFMCTAAVVRRRFARAADNFMLNVNVAIPRTCFTLILL